MALDTVQISDLGTVGTPNDADLFICEQGGVTYKVSRANIVAAVLAALNAEIATTDAEVSALQTGKVNKSGDTLTGHLSISLSPTVADHLTRKGYVDTQLALKLSLSGGTMTGNLELVGAPSIANHAATKGYVDSKILTTLSVLEDYTPAGVFPTTYAGGAIVAGNCFYVDTAGTVVGGTVAVEVGDVLIARTNAPLDNLNDWSIVNVNIVDATETVAGKIEIATTAETQALTDDTRAVTPAKLADALDITLYNRTVISTATYTLAESESGIIGVTRTLAGTCTITLPVISTLTNSQRVIYYIVDEGTAYINNITINAGAGDTIIGDQSFLIVGNNASVVLHNDGGTKWFITTGFEVPNFGGVNTYLSVNQSLADATWEDVQFDTVSSFNTQTAFDTATHLYTPFRANYFIVQATVYFAANATGVRGVRIVEDVAGDNVRATMTIPAFATYAGAVTVTAMFFSNSSSTIRVQAFQSSGGALNITGGTLQDSNLRIVEK